MGELGVQRGRVLGEVRQLVQVFKLIGINKVF